MTTRLSKRCSRCRLVKPKTDFKRDRRRKVGRFPTCKQCESEKAALPENKRKQRSRDLRRKFGISIEVYEALYSAQRGLCAICQRGNFKRNLAVDHDHQTGEVRGLLCGSCNQALGVLESRPGWAQAATIYLSRGINASQT